MIFLILITAFIITNIKAISNLFNLELFKLVILRGFKNKLGFYKIYIKKPIETIKYYMEYHFVAKIIVRYIKNG